MMRVMSTMSMNTTHAAICGVIVGRCFPIPSIVDIALRNKSKTITHFISSEITVRDLAT